MTNPSVPLSMLLTKDVPYEWHDAVALIAQLVAEVRSQDSYSAQTPIPDLRGLALAHDGRLVLSVNSDQSMPAMPGAAQILQQLLSGKEQPAQLRLFAMQAATSEPTPTLDDFAGELAKWERPNRTPKLTALHSRAVDQIGPSALADAGTAREDRALTEKERRPIVSAAAPPPPKPKKKAPAPDNANPSNAPFLIGVGVILFALIAGGGAWYVMNQPVPEVIPPQAAEVVPETAAPAPKPAASRPAAAAAATPATETPRNSAPGRPSAALSNAESELERAKALFERQDYATASVELDRVLQILEGDNSPQAEEIRQIVKSLAEVSRAAVVEETSAAANREYRSGEPGVTDPVPFSYLPPKPAPSTPPEKLQVLEVHVTTDGHVDAAKFVMNRPSFRNSWWTSAAKAWRFQPATKDGKPVRFLMRIVMDDSAAQH